MSQTTEKGKIQWANKKIIVTLLIIVIAAVAILSVAWVLAVDKRPPEGYVDSKFVAEKLEGKLYEIFISITVSPISYVELSVKTNGRIISVQPPLSTAFGKSSIVIIDQPTLFVTTKHLEITILVDQVVDELHYQIKISTWFGSMEVAI